MKAYGIGRLTKDIEIRMTSTGKKVATFTLACRRTEDITDFVSCVAWEKRAELLQAYTHRGSKIFVEGTVTTRNYDDNGRKVYVTELLVDAVTFCDNKQTDTRSPIPEVDPQNVEIDDDELPF